MNVVRIWLYAPTKEGLKFPDCKPSHTNKIITKQVRGDFKYYDISSEPPREITSNEAKKWSQETGQEVDTWRGYPAYMKDLGFKA